MKKIILFSILAAFLHFEDASAQHSQKELQHGKSLFDRLAYADAISVFLEVVANDPQQFEAKARLADSYRLTGNYKEAEKWYAKVILDTRATEADRFHYGQMLMNNGSYEQASKWLTLVSTEIPQDERVQNYLKAIDDISKFFRDSISYTLQNFFANGNGNDFSPAFYNKGVVFTSSSKTTKKSKRHGWTGESYTRLFYADSVYTTVPFAPEVSTPLNNGPATFSQETMFTTVNIKKVNNTKSDHYKLNIVSATFNGKRWSKPTSFPYNSADYNIAHPTLTKDGKRLYFSSDMPGGEGGMDLYYSERTKESWSQPISLGKNVNTPGNELFPFVDENGTLYFASNGHEGLGGLDVFVASSADNEWLRPIALSFPINTPYDDFGFIMDWFNSRGYFSSNRPGGKGGDDIYGFIFTQSTLEATVINKDQNNYLSDATVIIKDALTGEIQTLTTDASGKVKANISPCRTYEIETSHAGYASSIQKKFKSSCVTPGLNKTDIVFNNPTVTFSAINKFLGTPLDAFVELRLAESKTIMASSAGSTLEVKVSPCTNYVVTGRKAGMPEVNIEVKTSCVAANEVIRIPMGNPPVDPSFISGVVYDQDSRKKIDSAVVVVYDNANKAVATVTSAFDGSFGITGLKNISRLVFFKNGYFSVSKILATETDRKKIVAELPPLKLDKIIQLEGIYYDLGKSNIRPDAARVLDNLIEVLNENPSLEIELSAHTDARGRDESNLDLSDKRAKAAAAYIISKGVAESRIIGKGYGESVLKNQCGNGVKCNEKQHQENRRTEVRVTKY